MSKPRLVVLGGTGFIGRAVVAEGRRTGFEVVALRSADIDPHVSSVRLAIADLLTAGTILLFAARVRRRDDARLARDEDIALVKTISQLVAAGRLRKCVYLSSLAVYGDSQTNLSITEETPASPTSPYGDGKLVGEQLLTDAATSRGTPSLILRPCMVYGPGDRASAYGPSALTRSVVRTGRVSVFGDGADRRPYLFIDDAASVVLRLAVEDHVGTFNVASDESHSFEQILDRLRHSTDRRFEVVREPRMRPKTDLVVSPRKLQRALGDLTFTTLDEGLAATHRAFSIEMAESSS